jgi:1-aminocyclopropane-1-carboxylate deaminase/D-cysteine desulfhydrase-like pyridoxal-dependent ACC family enzyme
MSDQDYLRSRFPQLSARLPHANLASLPTPVKVHELDFASRQRTLAVKYDNLTGSVYGGNKIRKLEYIFERAKSRHCLRVATFGAAGSNHALATALYARSTGFECTCFLSHQAKSPLVAATLNKHIENGTELVRFGGSYRSRLTTLRENLWGRHTWVIPMGGSSWLGTIGFVAAGLELAAQVAAGDIDAPDRIYVGAGTMGTAVGIALGLALAELDTEVHAVRVSDVSIMNQHALDALLNKTATMMHRYVTSVPTDLALRTNIRIRNRFFAPGYAKGTAATEEAIAFGRDALDLTLETTYTGKTMSALMADWRDNDTDDFRALYWHTYNSTPLDVPADRPLDPAALPAEFLRYFEE